jgi:hypothetical protein
MYERKHLDRSGPIDGGMFGGPPSWDFDPSVRWFPDKNVTLGDGVTLVTIKAPCKNAANASNAR